MNRSSYADATYLSTQRNGRHVAAVAYLLNLLGYFSVVPLFVSLVINWVKHDGGAGEYAAHHRYMMRSVLQALLGYILAGGMIASVILMPVGLLMWGGIAFWCIWRDVRGLLRLIDDRNP